MSFKRYDSRFEAGEILAELIRKEENPLYNLVKEEPENFFCFAIPNGGIPVAEGFCNRLNIRYDLLIVRKIKIPWNTEAGFGSITTPLHAFFLQSFQMGSPSFAHSSVPQLDPT